MDTFPVWITPGARVHVYTTTTTWWEFPGNDLTQFRERVVERLTKTQIVFEDETAPERHDRFTLRDFAMDTLVGWERGRHESTTSDRYGPKVTLFLMSPDDPRGRELRHAAAICNARADVTLAKSRWERNPRPESARDLARELTHWADLMEADPDNPPSRTVPIREGDVWTAKKDPTRTYEVLTRDGDYIHVATRTGGARSIREHQFRTLFNPPPAKPSKPACECRYSCADDWATACSLSGEWHLHPGDSCPVHPDAPTS